MSKSIRASGIKFRPPSDGTAPNLLDMPRPPRRFYREGEVEAIRIGRRNMWRVASERKNGAAVFYLHGGSYIHTFEAAHWQYAKHLARQGYEVFLPDYPLLPDGNVRLAFDFLFRCWQKLLLYYPPERIALMGDSAGGGMALGFEQELVKQGWEAPKRAILLSPWLDANLESPEIAALDPIDPFLGADKLRVYGKRYAGDLGTRFPWISPVNGAFEGLSPVDIYMGSHDLLVADARKLYARAVSEGLPIDYYEAEGMFHVYMLFDLPEARTARERIDETLRASFDTHA